MYDLISNKQLLKYQSIHYKTSILDRVQSENIANYVLKYV